MREAIEKIKPSGTKRNKETALKVCELISQGYSYKDASKGAGISEGTFYSWKDSDLEFLEAIKKAEAIFNQSILNDCTPALKKLVNGYDAKETVTTYDKDGNVITHIEKTRHIQPNLGAIIHTQTNLDPTNWSNKQRIEHTGKDGDAINVISLGNGLKPDETNKPSADS